MHARYVCAYLHVCVFVLIESVQGNEGDQQWEERAERERMQSKQGQITL